MRRTTWVPAAAAVLLVVGVLATRGGSAAAQEDLRVAAPEPSRSPSVAPVQDGPVRLEANGLPGARLGSAGTGLGTSATSTADGRPLAPEDLPGGCVPAWSAYADGTVDEYDMSVWVVDDLVSSVVLTRWDPSTAVVSSLATWLGPTLGSPVAEASALPGARTSTALPLGSTGPTVTVVHVLGDGVDVVFSDVVPDLRARPDGAAGRITTVEVRHPRARGCSRQALTDARPLGGAPPAADLVLGPDGVGVLPLGTPEAEVLARPGVRAEEDAGVPGCRAYVLPSASGGLARVVVVDGVVVAGEAVGAVPSELGLVAGDPVAQVLRVFPQLAAQTEDGPPGSVGGGTVEVAVGDRVVRIQMWVAEAWVPEVDVPVRGGEPGVRSLSVRAASVDPARLC